MMPANYTKADALLMKWLKDRTDTELRRVMEAPDRGLSNARWTDCLAGCALGWVNPPMAIEEWCRTGTKILNHYGLENGRFKDRDGSIMRRIKGFVAAEIELRRLSRRALPAPEPVGAADG